MPEYCNFGSVPVCNAFRTHRVNFLRHKTRKFHRQRRSLATSDERLTCQPGEVFRLTPDHRGLFGRATARCLAAICRLSTHGWLLMRPRGLGTDRWGWSASRAVPGQRPAAGRAQTQGRPTASDRLTSRSQLYVYDGQWPGEECPSRFLFTLWRCSPALSAGSGDPLPCRWCCCWWRLCVCVCADICCHHRLTHD